jgi:quercetin dioxygenase-like cupin family protein
MRTLALAAFLLATQDPKPEMRVQPKPDFSAGPIVQYGDPKTGPNLQLIQFKAGAELKPHWHSADEVATVVSGTVIVGRGEAMEGGTEVGPGGWWTIPARTVHWGRAKTDAVIVRYGSAAHDVNYVK